MKISVALCTYNGAKYIREQLDSIINQSVSIDELIVCDDMSTDGTREILEEYQAQNDIPIRIHLNTERLGVTYNFQKALQLCQGDIILLSDQDDIWLPERTHFFLSYFMENKGTDLLFSNAELIDELGVVKHKTLFELLSFNAKTQKAYREGFGLEMSELLGRVSGFTIGIRKKFGESCLPFVKKYEYFIHDKQLVLCAIEKGTIDFTNKCLTKYRLHTNQVSDLYSYIINHNYLNRENKLFRFAPIRKDDMNFLKEKGFNNSRFDFSDKRRELIKSPVGIFLVLCNIKLYKKHYRQYAYEAIRFDIQSFIKQNKKRITKIFRKNR